MEKIKDKEQRICYIKKTIENGWSHSVFIHQIESKLYEREAMANKAENFESRLPAL